jgi:hypothetical protein
VSALMSLAVCRARNRNSRSSMRATGGVFRFALCSTEWIVASLVISVSEHHVEFDRGTMCECVVDLAGGCDR